MLNAIEILLISGIGLLVQQFRCLMRRQNLLLILPEITIITSLKTYGRSLIPLRKAWILFAPC